MKFLDVYHVFLNSSTRSGWNDPIYVFLGHSNNIYTTRKEKTKNNQTHTAIYGLLIEMYKMCRAAQFQKGKDGQINSLIEAQNTQVVFIFKKMLLIQNSFIPHNKFVFVNTICRQLCTNRTENRMKYTFCV